MRHSALTIALLATLGVSAPLAQEAPTTAAAAPVAAEIPADESLTRQLYRQTRLGTLNVHGDAGVVEALVHQLSIPVTYDHVATLLRTPNAFGEGPACVICHSSNDPRKSYRGLDLSTCEGLLRGATEPPRAP